MNKKGFTLLEVLMAFIVSIILVFAIFNIINAVLPRTQKEDNTVILFSHFVDEVDNLISNKGDNMNFLFSIGEKYVLLGFTGDLDYIGSDSKEDCDVPKINIPDKCRKKGCLCLCNKESFEEEDVNACKESVCYEFDYFSIIDSKNKCEIFLLEGESTNNLIIEKKDKVIDIHKEQ